MNNNPPQHIPVTPGMRAIMNVVKDELFPQIEDLKKLLVGIQHCRISYQLYSRVLSKFEKEYSSVSVDFFEVVKKLETPDILFRNVEGGEKNIVDYFQFQPAFQQNIKEGFSYIEIIDRTLDRKSGAVQNNRTFLISVIALVISIYFAR